MKYFKASICSLAAFASFSYINSAENADAKLWDDLKGKLKVSRNALGSNLQTDERLKQIDKGFQAIEALEGITIPTSLKELHRNAGTLMFCGTFVLSPIGGDSSPLHRLILEGRRQKISQEWITFAQIDTNEYFGINSVSGQVAWFTVIEGVKQYQTYPDLPTWLTKRFLKD